MPTDAPHRRDFVRALILGGPAATLAAGPAVGDEKDEPDKAPTAKPAPKSEADARMDLILARFANQLDDDARAAVRDEVEAIVRRAELLRKFSLDNGDGPFPIFIPYRGPID
jgi:hypothetical protein